MLWTSQIHGTLLSIVAIGLIRHELRTLANDQCFRLLVGVYCYITCNETKPTFITPSMLLRVIIHVEYCNICVYLINCRLRPHYLQLLKGEEAVFRSVWNIPPMHRLMNKISSSTSSTRYLAILERTFKHQMRMNRSTMPSSFKILRFAVRNCGALIGSMDSFRAGSRKSLLILLRLPLVWRKLSNVNEAFDNTPI